jgi:hypothetical protein
LIISQRQFSPDILTKINLVATHAACGMIAALSATSTQIIWGPLDQSIGSKHDASVRVK